MSSKDYFLCVVLFRIGNLLNFVGLIFVELLRLKSREKVLFDLGTPLHASRIGTYSTLPAKLDSFNNFHITWYYDIPYINL